MQASLLHLPSTTTNPHTPHPTTTSPVACRVVHAKPSKETQPFPSNKIAPLVINPVSVSIPQQNPLQKLAVSALDLLEASLIVPLEKKRVLPQTLDPAFHLSGNFAPVPECPVQRGLEVVGHIPDCLRGVYLRNGANPMFEPSGGHHLFDGEGMIHAVTLGSESQARYCCRYTRTSRLKQQAALGRQLFPKTIGELNGWLGLARLALFTARVGVGLIDDSKGIGVANAGLVYFNGRILALSEDDLPYHVKVNGDGDLETVGQFSFSGQLKSSMIAHPIVDPKTGDLHLLSYNVMKKPYLKYLRFDTCGRKSREIAITLEKPTIMHDFAITENFVLLPDHQVVFQLPEMILGGSPIIYDKSKTSRFGILPRRDINEFGILWINVPNFFCFHLYNAWEEDDDTIVVIGSCMNPPESIFNGSDKLIRTELTEIRLNLRTGEWSQKVLVSGMNLETGQVNGDQLGQKTQFVYLAIAEPWPRCGGIAKVDLESGEVKKLMYGSGRFGGEPLLVVTENDESEEGYVIGFVRDEEKERSELLIVSATTMEQVCSVRLPARVPYGFHGTFVSDKELKGQTSF